MELDKMKSTRISDIYYLIPLSSCFHLTSDYSKGLAWAAMIFMFVSAWMNFDMLTLRISTLILISMQIFNGRANYDRVNIYFLGVLKNIVVDRFLDPDLGRMYSVLSVCLYVWPSVRQSVGTVLIHRIIGFLSFLHQVCLLWVEEF